MRRRAMVAVAAVLAGMVGAVGAPAGAVSSFEVVNLFFSSSLSSVPVDVCVDGTEVATDLASGDTTGSLSSPGATIDLLVALHEDGVACAAKASVFIDEVDVAVPEGGIVMLFNGANDVGGAQPEYGVLPGPECVAADDARLTLVHAANAPAVDVVADGETVAADLSNGEHVSLDVAGGTTFAAVEVVPAGGGTPLLTTPLGPLPAGQETIAFVVGGVGGSPDTAILGAEALLRPLSTCAEPVTTTTTMASTTTTAPTTTTTAPSAAAAPVTAAPRFTG